MKDLISDIELQEPQKTNIENLLISVGKNTDNYKILLKWLIDHVNDRNIEDINKSASIAVLVIANYEANKISNYDDFVKVFDEIKTYLETNNISMKQMDDTTKYEIMINQYKIEYNLFNKSVINDICE